jgi:hypothetical protein
MRTAAVLAALAACGSPSHTDDDVTGPFTGPVQRFVVDELVAPNTQAGARALAADLDGDGAPDNQGGSTLAGLYLLGDGAADPADQIATGALASFVLVQADDPLTDDTVAVTYLGIDGAAATVVGGQFVDGVFQPNRLAHTRVPGAALVRIPAFADIDPIDLPAAALEIDLTPDGRGGYNGIVHAGLRIDDVRLIAADGMLRMVEQDPQGHLTFFNFANRNFDGMLTLDEVLDDTSFQSLVLADIDLFDGDTYAPRSDGDEDSMALAYRIHLRPCPTGDCALAPPRFTCLDRVLDGSETDLDCGGADGDCIRCPAAAHCTADTDCQTARCQPDGTCAAPTCSDGIRDGFENGVDTGGGC